MEDSVVVSKGLEIFFSIYYSLSPCITLVVMQINCNVTNALRNSVRVANAKTLTVQIFVSYTVVHVLKAAHVSEYTI